MQINFQLLFIFKGFFLYYHFPRKRKKIKDIILEAKTTFINDLINYRKQISPTTLILPPWAE